MKIDKVVFYGITGFIALIGSFLLIPSGADPEAVAKGYSEVAESNSQSSIGKSLFVTYIEAGIETEYGSTVDDLNGVNLSENYKDLLTLKEDGAGGFWDYITDGRAANRTAASSLGKSYWSNALEQVTVSIWTYDSSSNSKVSKNVTLRVNNKIAGLTKDLFADIYNSTEQPLINDVYCYSYRPKVGSSSLSAHALGLAFDINVTWNPYYGSSRVGGIDEYGVNGKVVTKEMYDTERVSDEMKRYVLYKDGAIVKYFVEKYTFQWGATFQSTPDRMHFSLANDGDWRDKANNYAKHNTWEDYYATGIK